MSDRIAAVRSPGLNNEPRLSQMGPDLTGQNVLVVGLHYSAGHPGVAPCTWQACEDLQRRGAFVQVLTGTPYHPGTHTCGTHGPRLSSDELGGAGVRINRFRVAAPRLTSRIRRAGYEATFGAHVLTSRLPWTPDVVVAVVPSLLAAVAAARIAKKAHARFVVWVQEFMGPAAATIGPVANGYGAAATVRLEGRLLRQADTVMVVNEDVRRYAEDAGVPEERIVVRPEWTQVERRRSDWPRTVVDVTDRELALAQIASAVIGHG